ETVGAGILALPIAVATIGPIAGIVILVILGIVNQLTIAAMVESVSRNGNIRYSHSFLGRVVTEYLGRVGALYLTPVMGATFFLVLWVFSLAFATNLSSATGFRVWVGRVVFFIICFFFPRRESLQTPITASLIIGAINIGLIVVISLLALTHLN